MVVGIHRVDLLSLQHEGTLVVADFTANGGLDGEQVVQDADVVVVVVITHSAARLIDARKGLGVRAARGVGDGHRRQIVRRVRRVRFAELHDRPRQMGECHLVVSKLNEDAAEVTLIDRGSCRRSGPTLDFEEAAKDISLISTVEQPLRALPLALQAVVPGRWQSGLLGVTCKGREQVPRLSVSTFPDQGIPFRDLATETIQHLGLAVS